jgi:hypothetical protein
MLPLQRPVTNVSPEPIHVCCPMPAAVATQSSPTEADAALRIDPAINAATVGWPGGAPHARS